MWYVYILHCKNGDLYKGCTNNITDRLARHSKGWVEATKELLPFELLVYIAFSDRYKAYKFEKYLKSGLGRAFIQNHLV